MDKVSTTLHSSNPPLSKHESELVANAQWAPLEAAEHSCWALDSSKHSSNMVAEISRVSPAVSDRYVLLSDLGQKYICYLLSSKFNGQMTVFAADEEVLLATALPAVVEKTMEIGGYCAFMPVVDGAIRDRIVNRLSELQPVPPTPKLMPSCGKQIAEIQAACALPMRNFARIAGGQPANSCN